MLLLLIQSNHLWQSPTLWCTSKIYFLQINIKTETTLSVGSIMQKTKTRSSLPVCRTCSFIKAWPLDVKHSIQVRRINVTKQLYNIHRPRLKIQQHRHQVGFCNDTTCLTQLCTDYFATKTNLCKHAHSLYQMFTLWEQWMTMPINWKLFWGSKPFLIRTVRKQRSRSKLKVVCHHF